MWQKRRLAGESGLPPPPPELRRGQVSSMWTCQRTSEQMQRKEELRCIAGVGVEGDRYNTQVATGRYSISPEPGRQITLIAAEGMERLRREHSLDIGPHNCRRNVVTQGIHLTDLLGRELRIGKVVLFAHRWTVPCMYLEGLLRQKGLFEAIYYDAGLCCEILVGGTILDGDAVEVVPGSPDLARCVTWPVKAKFVRPSERTAEERREILEARRALEEKAESDPLAKKRLRLADQAFGRKDETWDGGMSQW